jgi:hypothetical protein
MTSTKEYLQKGKKRKKRKGKKKKEREKKRVKEKRNEAKERKRRKNEKTRVVFDRASRYHHLHFPYSLFLPLRNRMLVLVFFFVDLFPVIVLFKFL